MTQAQQTAKRERTFTGRHMLIVVVAFFGVVIGVNLTMAVLASQSWTGLVVKNSYVASQHYNALLAEARQQDALGWQGALAYDGGRLSFVLKDRDGRPVPVSDASVRVSRPTHERDDRTIELDPASGGHMARTALAVGVWNADVTARRTDGFTYRAHFRLAVKSGG